MNQSLSSTRRMTAAEGLLYLLGFGTALIGGSLLVARGMGAVASGVGAIALAAAVPLAAVISAMVAAHREGPRARFPHHRDFDDRWSDRAPASGRHR